MITNVLLFIVGVLLLINLLAPLLIWKSQTIPARVSLAPIDIPGFLERCGDRFRELDAKLQDMGCDYLGSSQLELQQVTTRFSVYFLDGGFTIATLVTISGPDQEVVYVEFSRLYQDGSILNVNNSPIASAYPDMDVKIMARLPEHEDPAGLHSVFAQLADNLRNTSPMLDARNLDCFSTIEEYIGKESDELARMGYCHSHIDKDGLRRLTLKGAYLMTWGQLFPGSWLKKARDARYARRLLQAT
jgi:hypothetical protein